MKQAIVGLVIGIAVGYFIQGARLQRYEYTAAGPYSMTQYKHDRLTGKTWSTFGGQKTWELLRDAEAQEENKQVLWSQSVSLPK